MVIGGCLFGGGIETNEKALEVALLYGSNAYFQGLVWSLGMITVD
jgi:hypothetical protein